MTYRIYTDGHDYTLWEVRKEDGKTTRICPANVMQCQTVDEMEQQLEAMKAALDLPPIKVKHN